MRIVKPKRVNKNKIPVACRRITTIDKLQLKCYIDDEIFNCHEISPNITIEEIPSVDEFPINKTDSTYYKIGGFFMILTTSIYII
jgi:hypothetical protein